MGVRLAGRAQQKLYEDLCLTRYGIWRYLMPLRGAIDERDDPTCGLLGMFNNRD